MIMHTSVFYKNHHKYLSSEEFCFLVDLYIDTQDNHLNLLMSSENKKIIKSLTSKGYMKEYKVSEIKSDIRFFEIDIEEFKELRKKFNDLEVYTYFLIISLLSQNESVTNKKVAKLLGIRVTEADKLIDDLIQEEYLTEN